MPSPAAIRASRISLGLTQAQAGALVGVSDRAWRHWEAGRSKMRERLWEMFQEKAKEIHQGGRGDV